MQRSVPTLTLLTALLAGGACSRPAPQRSAAAAPGVGWAVVVLYNQPKDTAAFEKYYAEQHSPLFAAHAQAIGVTRVDLVKFARGADGKPAPFYREADLRWGSQDAMDKGRAAAGLKAVAADLSNFATGGYTILVGRRTN